VPSDISDWWMLLWFGWYDEIVREFPRLVTVLCYKMVGHIDSGGVIVWRVLYGR
jgi:hypothetical protein